MLEQFFFKIQLTSFIKFVIVLVVVISMSGGSHFITMLGKEFYKEQFIKKCRAGHISNQLKKVTFSKEEFKQLEWENDDEIILKGVFHDVVKLEILSSDSVLIVCFSDENETAFLAILEDGSEESNAENKRVKKYQFDEYLINNAMRLIAFDFIDLKNTFYYYSIKPTVDFLNFPLLPPEIIA